MLRIVWKQLRVGLVGNNKAYQTTYQYTTCGVNLCIVRHGKQRMGFSKIQAHLGNLKWDHILKEVLFNLATTYRIVNPVSLPVRSMNLVEAPVEALEEKESAKLSTQGLTSWYIYARNCVKVIKNRRNKFKVFANSMMLDRICCDVQLHHGPQTMWSVTTTKSAVVKVKSGPRCALCVGLVGSNTSYQIIYQCTTYRVNLCIVWHGKQRLSYFENWHGTKDLKALKNKTLSTPAP